MRSQKFRAICLTILAGSLAIYAAAGVIGVVEGTSGNDTMDIGYTDGDGDQVTSGADIIEGLAGDDIFLAEDDEAKGDTLRGGAGIDRLENGYSGTSTGAGFDLHISAATTFDSVEIIDLSAGNTAQALILDGTGTFDLSSVIDFVFNKEVRSSAASGALTVLMPNLDQGLTDVFLDGGADVTFTFGTNVLDRRVIVTLGSGDDVVTGGRGNDQITLGGGSDTVVLYDGFNDGAGNDNIYGFTAGGDDQLDVTALTDTGGGPVTTDEVTTVSLNSGTDTRLIFPNGERLRLYGVAYSSMDEESELEAAGIPGPDPLIVTSTADTDTIGTLRYAINHANNNTSDDDISFNIPGAGPHLITVASDLPYMTDDGITIDGTTQSGTVCNAVNQGIPHALKIELNGAGTINYGLVTFGNGTTVKGLTVTGFSQSGLFSTTGSSDFTVDCTYVGVRADNVTSGSNVGTSAMASNAPNTIVTRSVISGNGTLNSYGLALVGSGSTVTGTVIGLRPDGTTPMGNGGLGIYIESASTVMIGGTSAADRNVIGSNGQYGVVAYNNSGVTVIGNYIGTDHTGTVARENGLNGIYFLESTGAEIGRIGSPNIVTSPSNSGAIWFSGASTGSVVANHMGVAANGTPLGTPLSGVYANGTTALTVGDGTAAGANTIRNSAGGGITVADTAKVAILANQIFGNTGAGIDLNLNGVTANDNGDGDSGANDLLNFPFINTISANGTTSINYDFDLDVPTAATNGYRIEFFKDNTSGDTNGEGQTYLGFVDTGAYTSGTNLNFSGTLTTSEAVSVSDIISATATRKTGASSYDITSEFAVNKTATLLVSPLVVTSTADTNTLGTLRFAINHANANTGDDDITFNINGAGPHTIALSSALPSLSDANITLDGTTQSGATCGDLWSGSPHTLKIVIDATGFTGVSVEANDITIKGLAISKAEDAISFKSSASNGVLQCSYLGLTPDGSAGTISSGAVVMNGATSTLIGGLSAGEGNVIGSSRFGVTSTAGATDVKIRGNFVGTDPTGLVARPVTSQVISANTAVTWSDISKNLISGNTGHVILGTDGNETITGSSGDVMIVGNYIGVDRTGTTALANSNSGIKFVSGSISGVTIGGTSVSDRNVISGNTGGGIELDGVSDITILGNYIGLDAAGSAALGNDTYGIEVANGSENATIGDGTGAGRNVIAGNLGGRQIRISGTVSSGLSINGNYIGTDATGNTALVNGDGSGLEDAIQFGSVATSVNIANNIIGGHSDTGMEIFQGSSDMTIQGNSFDVGADGVSDISAPTGAGFESAIYFRGSNTNLTIGGTSVGQGNLIANGTGYGIRTGGTSADTVIVTGNTIRNKPNIGIFVQQGAVAIYSNSIYSNGGLGIALSTTGVTANDNGDGDSGANELLNFPVINSFASDGATDIDYDINLDAPAADYRIDFYRNSAVDPSGHGEGETHLGFVEFTHAGGNLTFTGMLPTSEIIGLGENISATTTRKIGPLTYDITSEFSYNIISVSSDPASLVVTKTVKNLVDGEYSIPGNDVIYTFSVVNEGGGPVTEDSIVLIDTMPPEIEFFNGDHDGPGPSTDIIGFEETGTTLTFDPATDTLYSNAATKPANMSECTYTPTTGYDGNVTFVCFNPKGEMQAGDPYPSFNIHFRARIK